MSKSPRWARIAVVSMLSMLAGCDSLDARPVFGQVKRDIAERTGQLVQWNTGSDEDAAAQARVAQLLQDRLTLDEAIQVAMLNNPHLQATYERLGIAQANLVQAGLLKNPIFDAEVKFLDNVSGTRAIVEMAVVQDFLDVLMVPLRRRLARAQLDAVRSQVIGKVLDVVAEVRIAFVSVQASEHTLATLRQNLQATDASYDAARRLSKAGNITDLELANERALYERSKLAVASAETSLVEARERMNRVLGLWGGRTTWAISPDLPNVPAEPFDANGLESKAVAASVDLEVLRDRMRVVAARTGIEATELVFPELMAGAAAEYEGPEDKWNAGPAVSVAIPVFDWGQARTAQGRHRLRALWQQYAATAIELRSAVRSATVRLRNARRQSEYYRRVLLPLAERVTSETQLQYNAMQLGVFQLLAAKRNEIDLRRQYIDARRDYWIARTELEQILAGRMLRRSQVQVSLPGGGGGMDEGGGGH
ncbi:MAG: TolC family protein [Phycisphaerae bacterium]